MSILNLYYYQRLLDTSSLVSSFDIKTGAFLECRMGLKGGVGQGQHAFLNFFNKFRDDIIQPGDDMKEESDRRVYFMIQHYAMIPKHLEELMFSLTRAFPCPPIYAFLVIGFIGTNIRRWFWVARPGCHKDHAERTGAFIILLHHVD